VYIHRSGLAVEVEAPGFLQNLLAAEDKSAVFGQGEEQVEFLRAHGCDEMQGYIFSCPVPVEQFVEILRSTAAPAASNNADSQSAAMRSIDMH